MTNLWKLTFERKTIKIRYRMLLQCCTTHEFLHSRGCPSANTANTTNSLHVSFSFRTAASLSCLDHAIIAASLYTTPWKSGWTTSRDTKSRRDNAATISGTSSARKSRSKVAHANDQRHPKHQCILPRGIPQQLLAAIDINKVQLALKTIRQSLRWMAVEISTLGQYQVLRSTILATLLSLVAPLFTSSG
jgi:hypothetical protein